MCGIFGMISKDGKNPDKEVVEEAIDRLEHRGPDDSGCFFEGNVALANRRLAILDLSEKGHQPMHYKGLTITYNGELYNYLEIRKELTAVGHEFKTKSDTEVILAAYKQWGSACLKRFNGMWAFAIHDPEKEIVFCSRDRFGIKPFYYLDEEKHFAFASEIKAFTGLPFWKAELHQEMASDYLIKGLQNHTHQTLFKAVKQVPAGHNLLYNLKNHQLRIEQYYDISAIEENSMISFEEAAEGLRNLLIDAVQVHSRSDVKVGSALSGGLDSSSIVALQYKLLGKKRENLEVVSYTSDKPKFDESPFVKTLVEKYPVKVHWAGAGFEDTMEKIDEVVKAHDEPLLSASLIAQYFVFKTAKENGLKVMFDGQGADEILAGYGTYYLPFLKEIGINRPFILFKELLGLFGKHEIKPSKKLSFFKKEPNYQQYLKLPVSKPELSKAGFRNYSDYMITKGILPALLQFEDRNSMAHSVESRVPFLDYRLVAFCMSLPAEFKINKGIRKAILREAMNHDLPEKILERYDKMGFSTPQEDWMSENPDWMMKILEEVVNENINIFENSLIDFAREALYKKQLTHYAFLWRVMTFGRWMELMKIKVGYA